MTTSHTSFFVQSDAESDELFKFVFRSVPSQDLLYRARVLLEDAPKEITESFEQSLTVPDVKS